MPKKKTPGTTTPELKVEMVPLDDIHPHPDNYRSHPADQMEHLVESLNEFGVYRNVVLAEDGTILAGHGVVAAARERGDKTVSAVRMAFGPNSRKARKLMVVDNQVSRLAEDADDQLAALLKEIGEADDLLGTGYDPDELAALLGEQEEPGEDPGPGPVPEEPVTKAGDVWVMGEHRLVCGDCTSIDVWDVLCGEERIPLLVTDPPYNVGKEYANESLSDVKMADFYREWMTTTCAFLAAENAAYVFVGNKTLPVALAVFCGVFGYERTIAWYHADSQAVFSPDYFWHWTPVLYGSFGHLRVCKRGSQARDHWEVNVSSIKGTSGAALGVHPTKKPVEVYIPAIETSSEPGDLIADPFLGSGTALVAAEQTGRRLRGIEISDSFCDCAVNRWQTMTGQRATLESTGEEFPTDE